MSIRPVGLVYHFLSSFESLPVKLLFVVLQMVEVGGAEPPPPYTTYVNTTVTTGGYPNPAYVAPPAYTTQQEAQGGATTQDTGTGTNKGKETLKLNRQVKGTKYNRSRIY